MKGFMHLLEIIIATILISVVLATLFSVRIKENWEDVEIIDTGNNMITYLSQNKSYIIELLEENLTRLNKIKPNNINFGLEFMGSTKSSFLIGCTDIFYCQYVEDLLDSSYVNDRWINFTVEYLDLSVIESIPYIYDAVFFVNYTDYSTYMQKINDYLNVGGTIIGINDTTNFDTDQDFKDLYNVSSSSGGPSDLSFISYDPYENKIAKYFLGYGFDADTNWYIWGDNWSVVYGSNYVNLTRTSDLLNKTFLSEGNTFSIRRGVKYLFKVRKIWGIQRVDIQPLNTTFPFEDFSEDNCEGNNILVDFSNSIAGLTTNNSAVWVSGFPQGDEYEALMKAIISAENDNWVVKTIKTSKDLVKVTSFYSLCCDMPETSELILSLSYII